MLVPNHQLYDPPDKHSYCSTKSGVHYFSRTIVSFCSTTPASEYRYTDERLFSEPR